MVDAPIRLSGNQHFHFGTLMPFRVGASIPLLSGRDFVYSNVSKRPILLKNQFPGNRRFHGKIDLWLNITPINSVWQIESD
jgi:hypothetical protein